MTAAPALVLDGAGVRLGGRAVLDAVTATAGAGELVAIVGPNGAGKTTLLRLLAGLLSPTSGAVRTLGAAPTDHARAALARRLAYVPQHYELAFPFTVAEVVLMGRYPHRRGPWLEDKVDHDAMTAALARFDLAALATRRFDQLSGGEQRRVLLAQAACQGASVCLLDEPTAALDPAHAQAVFAGLRAMADDGGAVVVVSHDLNLAVRHATALWVLADGRLVARGAPAEVVAQPALAAAFGVALHVGTLPSGAPFVVTA
ncbi:MAG: ATP-binding cassette domain-containing protein [Kofleriaceae bacterium]